MQKQAKMINRLIDIKQRAADAAETAHVAAHTATRGAEETLRHALNGWKVFLEGSSAARAPVSSVHDLEDRDSLYKWLRRAIDDAERGVALARTHESATRETMTEARIELRRFETWLDNTKEAHRTEATRVQRLADDEVAARKTANGAWR